MKTHFIRITSLALCLLFAISLCACNKGGDKDLKLSDLEDLENMTPSEVESRFGKPVKEYENGVWGYGDDFTFYGIKLDRFTYNPSDHSVNIHINDIIDKDAPEQAYAKIKEFCTFDHSFGGMDNYTYNNLKIAVSGSYFYFKFS